MARKHNVKHERSPSNYKKRLADRGLGKTPRMKWTGLTATQIQNAFAELPRYNWKTVVEVDEYGRKSSYQIRTQVG